MNRFVCRIIYNVHPKMVTPVMDALIPRPSAIAKMPSPRVIKSHLPFYLVLYLYYNHYINTISNCVHISFLGLQLNPKLLDTAKV